MKLFPLLLIGLAPHALVLEPNAPKAAPETLDVSVLAAEALVLTQAAQPEAQEPVEPVATEPVLAEPVPEAEALAAKAEAEAQRVLAQEPQAGDEPEPAADETPEADPEPAPELLDVREVDPREFASGLSIEGPQAQPTGEGDPLEATATVPIDEPEPIEGSYLIGASNEPVEYVEVAGTSHAPIGIPLSRQVATGQWALVVRASQDRYDGLRDSRDDLSTAEAFAGGYTIAPTERADSRLEIEALFGLDERWDLYALLPYSARDLDYESSLTGPADVDTHGLGDIQIGGIFRSYDVDGTRLSYLIGVSIPTGDVSEKGDYAGLIETKLPYDLQQGTGTFDLHPGVLWESRKGELLMGARAEGRIHMETENDEGYFWSNSMRVDLWAGTELADDLTGTLRVRADWWGDLHSFDADLDPTQSPGEDSLRQGGTRVNLYGGVSWDLNDERTQQLGLEVGVPVDEWLDGPQLSQELSLLLGWRASF